MSARRRNRAVVLPRGARATVRWTDAELRVAATRQAPATRLPRPARRVAA